MPTVFVSHHSADAALAERLAAELRADGNDVWLDRWSIDLGDSIVGRMNEGLESAAYLVLCCCQHGVTGPWIGREWMSALSRQLEDQSVKVLPVLFAGGRPPVILADIMYADLAAEWDA